MSNAADNRDLRHALSGVTGTVAFLGITVLAMCVVAVVCLDPNSVVSDRSARLATTLQDVRPWCVVSFICILGLGWFAFSASEAASGLLWALGVGAVLTTGCIALGLTRSMTAFWPTLAVLALLGCINVADYRASPMSRALSRVFVTWAIVGSTLTLGSNKLLGYAGNGPIGSKHWILDVRYVFSGILMTLLVGKSLWAAFAEGTPRPGMIPNLALHLQSQGPITPIQSAIRPFLLAINATIRLLTAFVNVLWRLFATLGAYLIRAGVHLANAIYALVRQRRVILVLAQTISTFVVLVLVGMSLRGVADDAILYLRSDTSPAAMWEGSLTFVALRLVCAYVVAFVIAWLLASLWMEGMREPITSRAMFGATAIAISWALVGIGLFGANRIGWIRLTGFETIGVFSICILLPLFGLACLQFVRLIRRGSRSAGG